VAGALPSARRYLSQPQGNEIKWQESRGCLFHYGDLILRHSSTYKVACNARIVYGHWQKLHISRKMNWAGPERAIEWHSRPVVCKRPRVRISVWRPAVLTFFSWFSQSLEVNSSTVSYIH
jgi:hypothetical protein